MIRLFQEGGPIFMGLITVVFVAMIITAFMSGAKQPQGEQKLPGKPRGRKGRYVKHIGSLALLLGVLGTLIGLYSAFEAISKMEGGVSTPMLAGGLRVSLITTLYGLVVYIIGVLISLFIAKK